MTLLFRRNRSTATTSQRAATCSTCGRLRSQTMNQTPPASARSTYSDPSSDRRTAPDQARYSYGKFWVALDLLLVSPTLKDALPADKTRQAGRPERY